MKRTLMVLALVMVSVVTACSGSPTEPTKPTPTFGGRPKGPDIRQLPVSPDTVSHS
jgi:hypothetical protein